MVRPLTSDERAEALSIINTAARWYRELLPAEEVHEPEMTPAQYEAEARRMTWFGAFLEGPLTGVVGPEYVRDAALLRHAYVLPECQRRGIGSQLRARLEPHVQGITRIIVGIYAGNYKARGAVETAGYRLSPDSQAVLRSYYTIPVDRFRVSVACESWVGSGVGEKGTAGGAGAGEDADP
jgi:GNAT superfamily N-acetyltransferase